MQRVWRRFGSIPAIVAVASLLGTGAARARDTDKAWEVGLFGFAEHHDVASNVGDTPGVGGRVGYHFSAEHELELDVESGSGSGTLVTSNLNYTVRKFTALFVRNYLPKGHDRMAPFLQFGLGDIAVDNGTDRMHTDQERIGGGIKYYVTPRFAVRFDGGGYSWYGDSTVTARTRLYTSEATLGISILIGGKTP